MDTISVTPMSVEDLADSVSSFITSTYVKCAATEISVASKIALTASWVSCLVVPLAPYVTETNLGHKGASVCIMR